MKRNFPDDDSSEDDLKFEEAAVSPEFVLNESKKSLNPKSGKFLEHFSFGFEIQDPLFFCFRINDPGFHLRTGSRLEVRKCQRFAVQKEN